MANKNNYLSGQQLDADDYNILATQGDASAAAINTLGDNLDNLQGSKVDALPNGNLDAAKIENVINPAVLPPYELNDQQFQVNNDGEVEIIPAVLQPQEITTLNQADLTDLSKPFIYVSADTSGGAAAKALYFNTGTNLIKITGTEVDYPSTAVVVTFPDFTQVTANPRVYTTPNHYDVGTQSLALGTNYRVSSLYATSDDDGGTVLGIDPSNGVNDAYTGFDAAIYITSNVFHTVENGVDTTRVAAMPGDRMGFSVVGTVIKAVYYRNGTWNDLATFGVTRTTALYIHAGIANDLRDCKIETL